jgi:hypothetical protein
MSYFSGEDLIFYKDPDSGNIMSGGYSIQSILLKDNMSPMTTLNLQHGQYGQYGGVNGDVNDKVSNIFDNLAVPAGLFYTPQKGSGINNNNNNNEYSNASTLDDDIHDQLFKLIQVNKSNKKSTKKNKNKINNKISKKNK